MRCSRNTSCDGSLVCLLIVMQDKNVVSKWEGNTSLCLASTFRSFLSTQASREEFLFMNFVQIQQITMPGNVRYIPQMIAGYCCKGLVQTVLGANWFEFVPGSLRNLQRNIMLSWTLFIVRHGNVLTVVIVRHFGLQCIRDAHLCVNGSLVCECETATQQPSTTKIRRHNGAHLFLFF